MTFQLSQILSYFTLYFIASHLLQYLLFYFGVSSSTQQILDLQRGTQVVLCGPNNAGKTRFFYFLLGHETETITSQEVNSQQATKQSKYLPELIKLTDIPGHSQHRSQLDQYLNQAKLILLLIDMSEKQSIKDAAQILYTQIFPHDVVRKYKTLVLIIFNKLDLAYMETLQSAKEKLKREIQKHKLTNADEADLIFGHRIFDFSQVPVDFEVMSLETPLKNDVALRVQALIEHKT